MARIVVIFTLCLIIIIPVAVWMRSNSQQSSLLHPIVTKNVFTSPSLTTSSPELTIFGFLPFWTINKTDPQSTTAVTDLVYFGIQLAADGSLLTHEYSAEKEPGWHRLDSGAWSTWKELWGQGETHIAISAYDNESLLSILTNTDSAQTAVSTIGDIVALHAFSGINIDFEPSGEVSPEMRTGMTTFMNMLHEAYPNLILSVDVYGNSYKLDSLWDLSALEEAVDFVLIMAYDYHRAASPISGSVSPLYVPHSSILSHSIVRDVAQTAKKVPRFKLLLGVPLYGYEWRVTDEQSVSTTYPNSGRLRTMAAISTLYPDQIIQTGIDSYSLTPWMLYRNKSRELYSLHYDDSSSLALKYEIVQHAGLGGTAVWALGYVESFNQLWAQIVAKTD